MIKEKGYPLFFSAKVVLDKFGLGASITVRWINMKMGLTDRKLEQNGVEKLRF